MNKFCVGGVIGIDHQQLLLAASQDTVYLDLAILNPENSACPCIHCVIFDASPVAEYYNDLVIAIFSN
ncbi:hypothetical protein ColLi_04886 [Colletotrichum liriopes]|uniref:Uncharacterized protein n=1 Tax=Colletotrichum liriopes TaxID=708192 RepID=A0AA37LS85_9PEZI|nr:hypothetical protein ColLi_04886 [Colletotrichum liriopes]